MSTNSENTLPSEIGKPALRALATAGVTHLEQLPRCTKRDILALHGVGPKAVRLLRAALKTEELSLAEEAHNND